MTTGKTIALTRQTFVGKVMSLLLNMLSRLVITFLPSSSESKVAQSCLTLCDPMDCSLPGSSIHEILQARILECIAISLSRGSSQPRDLTQVSHTAGRSFNLCATREAQRRLRAEELMLLSIGVGEDSCESLGLQEDPTSPF